MAAASARDGSAPAVTTSTPACRPTAAHNPPRIGLQGPAVPAAPVPSASARAMRPRSGPSCRIILSMRPAPAEAAAAESRERPPRSPPRDRQHLSRILQQRRSFRAFAAISVFQSLGHRNWFCTKNYLDRRIVMLHLPEYHPQRRLPRLRRQRVPHPQNRLPPALPGSGRSSRPSCLITFIGCGAAFAPSSAAVESRASLQTPDPLHHRGVPGHGGPRADGSAPRFCLNLVSPAQAVRAFRCPLVLRVPGNPQHP